MKEAKPPQLHSKLLSPEDWPSMFEGMSKFFKEALPRAMLIAEYGFGCEIHGDLTFIPMRVPVPRLHEFISESLDQRIFLAGRSDLHIHTEDRNFTITFCHEGDIHLSGNDTGLIQRFLNAEPFVRLEFTSGKQ